ncbi:unnamed protein product [Camellia sinensis]
MDCVLSISKALSIQAHLDKEFAGFLHKTLSDVFKDDNYKPEMALALIEFEALCGFISLKFTQSVTMGGLSLDGFLLEKVAEKLQLLKKNLGEGDFSALIELRKTVVEFSAQSQLMHAAQHQDAIVGNKKCNI